MTLETGQIRYVIAAAETGSFRQAAEALRVQQSTVAGQSGGSKMNLVDMNPWTKVH